MPLRRYGVLVGAFARFEPDSVGEEGQFLHGNVFVDAPPGTWRCAVDVSQRTGAVEFLHASVPPGAMTPLLALPAGLHRLASTAQSGALDVVRTPWLTDVGWRLGNGDDALAVLEALLPPPGRTVLCFGDPFRGPGGELGLHNVHVNQGDPKPHRRERDYWRRRRWHRSAGPWQDGAVVVPSPDGSAAVFVTKFPRQVLGP